MINALYNPVGTSLQKKILLPFLLLLYSQITTAQNAYDHWLQSQQASTHLKAEGNYSKKETYKSATGLEKDLKLLQEQYYEAGYLREDVLYTEKEEKLYHVELQLPPPLTWQNIAQKGAHPLAGMEVIERNKIDSSTSTYSFDEAGRLKYYVVDNQGSMHAVYTYREEGHLARYKDCLAPFKNTYWCAYYIYEYNEKQQLVKALSYNLAQDQTPDQKELFAIDSMVYNEKGQLIEKWTMDSARVITQKATYQYSKQGKLCREKSTQLPLSTFTRAYEKTFCYHKNGQPKKQQDAYYFGGELEIRQERLYNRQGYLTQQATYKRQKQPISLYQIIYKK